MENDYLCHQKERIMNTQPKLMDVTRMCDILTPHLSQIREHVFLSSQLAMLRGDSTVFRLILRQKPPFVINDHRFGIIISGHAEININLQDRQLTSGTLVYLGPGTIIHPKRLSSDLRIFGLALFSPFPMPFPQGLTPVAFNGHVRDFQLHVNEDDMAIARHILHTIWQIVQCPAVFPPGEPPIEDHYHRPTVTALVTALMHHYDHLYHQQAHQQARSRSREQTIFDRFLQLVNQHCTDHHHIGYYASRMCLTERYLTTVIRQASDATAKDWIDRALITRIKIELRHTDKTVAQISEEMHFANRSFFTKYFRRLTGMTPSEYKSLN